MREIKGLTKHRPARKVGTRKENAAATDAIRRAEAFPVQGGDIVPVRRKSWFEPVKHKRKGPRRLEPIPG